MEIVLRTEGLVSRVSYALSRYRILGLPLDIVVMLASLAAIPWEIWAAFQGRQATGAAILVSAFCLLLSVLLLALRLKCYVVVREEPFSTPHGAPELRPEEKVGVRVTGLLEVQGKRRYFVEAPASFHTTELQDSIVMARVRSRRSMGPVKSDADEWGWWYAFIAPGRVRSIRWVWFYHGLSRRRAVRLVYALDDGRENLLYLSFDRPEDLALVAQDLCSRNGVRVEPAGGDSSLTEEKPGRALL